MSYGFDKLFFEQTLLPKEWNPHIRQDAQEVAIVPFLKFGLVAAVMLPAAFVMFRTVADIRRDITRSRKQTRAQATENRGRFRVIR